VRLSLLREFLDRNGIRYTVISHSVAYTAQGIAAFTHTPGRELANAVMVMVDGRLPMAVVPASLHVDLYRLKKYLGAETVELASENEFRDHFADCETGSMPPFGNLYGMDVFVDRLWPRLWPRTRKSPSTPVRTVSWCAGDLPISAIS
jgi:Ala-tRNA(Pro) deacylase